MVLVNESASTSMRLSRMAEKTLVEAESMRLQASKYANLTAEMEALQNAGVVDKQS